MRINDRAIQTFATRIAATPTKAIDDSNVIELLAAVADRSGVTGAQALARLPSMSRQQQFDYVKAGLSGRETTDIKELLDKGGFSISPSAKNFLEALVGRATFNPNAGGTPTPPPGPVTPPGPFALTGTLLKPEDKIVSTASHTLQLATVVGGQALPDLRVSQRTITDPEQKPQIIDAATLNLPNVKTAAEFKTLMTGLQATHKAFISPDKAALHAKLPKEDQSNYAFLNITGRRLEQFFGEAQRLIGQSGMPQAEQAKARVELNASFRDAFRGRTVQFDKADTGTYWSYGHDAAFAHVFERMLTSLPDNDPKRKYIQNQIDFIFTNKYAYSGKVTENDAEQSIGLVAIHKGSRSVISMTVGSDTANNVRYETLKIPQSAGGANAGRNVYRDGTQLFFEGTRTELTAAEAAQVKGTPASRDDIVFRRKANNEQLRQDFRFDWDGNGMLNTKDIDTGWWGHCDIQALMETLLADMGGSAGVSEYRADTKRVTDYSRAMQLEGLAAMLNFDDIYQSTTSPSNRVQFGTTNFAGARHDNRPTVMKMSTSGGSMSLPIRLSALSEKGDSTKSVDVNTVFQDKIADAKKETFTANKDLLRVEQGDMHVIDGSGRKLEGTTDGYSFDARGWPIESKTSFEVDLNATTGDKVLIGTQLRDVNARTLDRFYFDPKTKMVERVETTFVQKQGSTTYEAQEGRKSNVGTIRGVELSKEMEAGDDVKNKLKMLEDAVKTGAKIATDSDTRDQVWNGEVNAVRFNTEWRSDDGKWERVGVTVDSRFGSGKVGTFIHELDANGQIKDSMEVKAAVDFYWSDSPRIAPLVSERGNWYVNEAMLERGVIDLGAGKAASLGAMQDLSDLIFLGFKAKDNKKLFTIVDGGKRYVYEDKAAWDKDVAALKARDAGGTGPTPPPQPGKVIQASRPNLTVPDNDPTGITDTISVTTSGAIKDIKVKLELRHSYVGDLDVKLIAPNGTEVKLHARGGRNASDLVGTYGADLRAVDDMKKLVGTDVKGDWKIKVVDLAGQDVGTLNEWSLDIDV